MPDRALLSVFTPSRTRPEDLEAIFVQRHALLNDTFERVQESATTGNKHHQLFVGPRGTGKTHLATLLVHRLGKNKEINKHLRIAWLNEDETSTTMLELLLRIYTALIKRYPEEFNQKTLEPLFDLKADEAEHWLADLLLASLKKHTLLVIIENLDALFQGLGKSGQQKLRAFIQENPVLSIVATAQKLVDGLSKRDSAFFGFFQTTHLKPLLVEDAEELLVKIASLNKQDDVVEFLRSAKGRARIRALHHLSGGNHRIYIVLSQFITPESIDALVGPFSKMIDEMTPYYQERIRWLPAQQRKIVEYLCNCERPAPVKEIARQLFSSHQTISSQLKDLRAKGYVQSAQRGRESLYEITEPLMRICVEIKENQSHAPLRMLVDFLRVWYNGQELDHRLEDCETDSIAHAYLRSAIRQNSDLGNLRVKLLVEGFCAELSGQASDNWHSNIKFFAEKSEELGLACGEWAKGDDSQALATLKDILKPSSKSPPKVKAYAWYLLAWIYHQKDNYEKEIGELNCIINQSSPSNNYLLSLALYKRGIAFCCLDDMKAAKQDFEKNLQLNIQPIQVHIDTHLALAQLYLLEGVWDSTISSVSNALIQGKQLKVPYLGDSSYIIDTLFGLGSASKLLHQRLPELIQTYQTNDAISQLGESLTKHLELLSYDKNAENLEHWALAWENAGQEINELRLPLRIFRTGINFLKSERKDQSVLLDLNQEERKILEQLFNLKSTT